MANVEKNQENFGNIATLMTSDDRLECFEIECDEDETDCTECCMCELEMNNFCGKPCGHLMCIFYIEEDECRKCNTKVDSKFAIILSRFFIILFCCQLIVRVSSFLVQILDVLWSILAFQILFS